MRKTSPIPLTRLLKNYLAIGVEFYV